MRCDQIVPRSRENRSPRLLNDHLESFHHMPLTDIPQYKFNGA